MYAPDIIAIVRNFFGSGYPQVVVLEKDVTTRQPTYVAVGARGSSTASPNWKVFKFTYDGDGDFQTSKTSNDNQIADDYLTLEYL